MAGRAGSLDQQGDGKFEQGEVSDVAVAAFEPVSYAAEDATVRLEVAGTYRGGFFNASASESVAYDAGTRRLFVANNATKSVDVVSIEDPFAPTKQFSIDVSNVITARGSPVASPESVAVSGNGLLAVALAPEGDVTERGKVAFFTTDVAPGDEPIKVLPIGFTPTMTTFTPNGQTLLVANEGEPTGSYVQDPPGLISLIDLTKGVEHATPRTVDFASFNDDKDALIAAGVRVSGPDLSTSDPNDTAFVASDLEPEHIAVSGDSRTAWVTLPENNAVAVVDISEGKVTDLLPFGFKDHSLPGNELDATDNDNAINIRSWPIKGMYMPSQVATYTVDGETYLVFGNEGTRRDYEAFQDEIRVDEAKIDPEVLSQTTDPEEFQSLRLKVSKVDGDTDGDGDLDDVFAFGARSFSIRSPDGELIFDSKDDFEQITARAVPEWFNTPDDETSFDQTSDLRGPEPISVTTGTVGDHTYAFIGLERIGGVMVYDVSDPEKPEFQQYINNRNFALNAKEVCPEDGPETPECAAVGDLSPEDLLFIPRDQSPDGTSLLVVSNETSGTATIFQIQGLEDSPLDAGSLQNGDLLANDLLLV